ncbi:hypothetical protein M409DRAFT_20828 [Zasmidium cellare ATCC 36951]|uniref:Uncharacterized protein n=1 Tax=Zasmidium cellare ATCC 36951 TaxID=1080233 RepID=A0A6A6CP23_ZASCE|nr:uncharacterized protein M409DRAFT_20828 [Zasmidium cellare ATCC 36951]KAF2168811.1 hypothetical protein M409DRAFT_20828 [Zasmidium cellare ATCC 36951]
MSSSTSNTTCGIKIEFIVAVFECPNVSISQEELAAATKDHPDACLSAVAVSSPGRYCKIQHSEVFDQAGKESGHRSWLLPETEISYVLWLLNSINIGDNKNGLLAIYTNANCTLQVHIGAHLPTRGISRDQTKRILQLYALFERALDTVQSDQRIRYGPMDTLGWINQLMGANVPWQVLDQWYMSFPITQSHIDLSKLTVSRKSMRINDGLVVANRTIEFRQHASTLDIDEILGWANVCEAIVDYACAAQPWLLQQYAYNKWFDLEYSLPQVLADVGATQETVEHYERVLSADDSYERDVYSDSVQAISNHPMSELLQHVAAQRYLHFNRAASGMATNFKVLNGHYGWFPQGSPYAQYGSTLPVVAPEHMHTFQAAAMQTTTDMGTLLDGESLSRLSRSTSLDIASNQDLGPGDSASQVGTKRESFHTASTISDKADSALSLGVDADGKIDWVDEPEKSIQVENHDLEQEEHIELPERRRSIP